MNSNAFRVTRITITPLSTPPTHPYSECSHICLGIIDRWPLDIVSDSMQCIEATVQRTANSSNRKLKVISKQLVYRGDVLSARLFISYVYIQHNMYIYI